VPAGIVLRVTGRRLARITALTAGFAYLVRLSRLATEARAPGEAPPIAAALAAISLVILFAAFAAERLRGPEANLQKDVFWGISLGGLLAVCLMVL